MKFKVANQLVYAMGLKMHMMVTHGTKAGNTNCVAEIGVNIMDTDFPISWTEQKGPSHRTYR